MCISMVNWKTNFKKVTNSKNQDVIIKLDTIKNVLKSFKKEEEPLRKTRRKILVTFYTKIESFQTKIYSIHICTKFGETIFKF